MWDHRLRTGIVSKYIKAISCKSITMLLDYFITDKKKPRPEESVSEYLVLTAMLHDTEIAVHGIDSGNPRQRLQELLEMEDIPVLERDHDELTSAHDHIPSFPIDLTARQEDIGIQLSKSQ